MAVNKHHIDATFSSNNQEKNCPKEHSIYFHSKALMISKSTAITSFDMSKPDKEISKLLVIASAREGKKFKQQRYYTFVRDFRRKATNKGYQSKGSLFVYDFEEHLNNRNGTEKH